MRWVFLLGLMAGAATGCGGVRYAVLEADASARIEEAKVAGAERFATYEYYYAREHLEQAKVEALEAHYSDAIALAEAARDHARAALADAARATQASP